MKEANGTYVDGKEGDSLLAKLLAAMQWAQGGIYAPVMPFSMTADGSQAAQTASVLAIRLHADGTIDADSLLASLPEEVSDRVSVEW